jgi:hypothetical protein
MKISRSNLIFGAGILVLTTVIGIFFQQPQIAMWLGFTVAALSTISNDSIQSLGTFLSSNQNVKWWILWFFIGGIAIATLSYGWYFHSGEVAFERLSEIPEPDSFTFFQIYAPVVLLILTWFRIPISTTFLILSVFSTSKTIESMLAKTFIGYVVAFVVAILFWGVLVQFFNHFYAKKPLSEKSQKTWRILQWCATAFLWMSWIMQDTANIVVFLPRELSLTEFLGVITIIFSLIGIVFYFRGGKMQSIVEEKKDVKEVRAATMIDFVFACILIYFKELNTLPMSTTWVFLGVLAGREIALMHFFKQKESLRKTFRLIIKDIGLAAIGLVISILLAWVS